MNKKHRKTLARVFERPVPKNLIWTELEALFILETAVGRARVGCDRVRWQG